MNRIRIFNVLKLKYRKRELRHNQTHYEKILWDKLKQKNLGFRFHRQYGVGPYILDFYCPHRKIAIELDGYSHRKVDVKKYDKYRNDFLIALRIRTLRFWNHEVEKDLTNVMSIIQNAVSELPLNPPL